MELQRPHKMRFELHARKKNSGPIQLLDFFLERLESGQGFFALAKQNNAHDLLVGIRPPVLVSVNLSDIRRPLGPRETNFPQPSLMANDHSFIAKIHAQAC